MRRDQILRALGLGLVLSAAYIGLTFGDDIARFRHMSAALAQMEECQELNDAGAEQVCVDGAYMRLQAARGGK